MAAEVIVISLLTKKLSNLLDDKDIVHPRLRRQITNYIKELEDLEATLEKVGSIKLKEGNQESFHPEILQDVYSAEDIIDDFLVKSSMRRQRFFFMKMRLFAGFMSALRQINLSRKMDTCSPLLSSREQLLLKNPRKLGKSTDSLEELEDETEDGSRATERPPPLPVPPGDSVWDYICPPLSDDNRYFLPSRSNSSANDREEEGIPDLDQEEESQAPLEKFSTFPQESGIVGMEEQEKDLLQLILSKQRLLYLISVTGPSGSGKTALVKKVCAKVDVRKHFECGAWVEVAKDFEEGDLLMDVLRQVTSVGEEERLPLESLRKAVRSFLCRKRYLIVLNDIHSPDLWGTLKFVFPNSLNGSRVILTIQDTDGIVRSSDQWVSILQVRPLTKEESWFLFLKNVRTTEDSLKESGLINLKEKILSKCNGLPLAIVLLGGLLRSKKLNNKEWSKVIENATLSADQSTSWDIMAMGYQDLSSPLKACLLYLGQFPRSYEIPIRRLLHLWVAEGLAVPAAESTTTETPEDIVEGYLKELVGRNMIEVARWRLDGSPRTCRVPGILNDTLFPNAANMGFFHIHNNSGYTSKPDFKVRRIAEYLDISSYPASDPYSICHLRTYVSFNCRKGDSPTNGFDKLLRMIVAKRGYGLLSVLDLEHVYKPVLSEAIGRLPHLKYLGVRWTFLDSIPKSIVKLRSLETLDMKHTNITTLPISIWKVTTLRHLYMNDIHFDMSANLQNPSSSSITETLASLQTLWGLLIGKNSSVVTWLQRLTSLRKLGLTCHVSSMEKIMDWISGLKDLQSLRLRSVESNRPSLLKLKTLKEHNKLNELYLLGKLTREISIDELPQNLKILTLSVSQLEEDPMPKLGKLPKLNILRLFARSYSGEEMRCLGSGFTQLRVLKLWMLVELKKWTIEERSMPSLKELEIRCCPKLELLGGLMHVTTLKELTLTNMPSPFGKQMKQTLRRNDVYIKINNWDFPISRKSNGMDG